MAGKTDIRQRLLAKFRGIARERIAAIGAGFEALCGQSGEPDTADAMMREIHTLKGEARIMGFGDMNDIAHATEDLLAWAREHAFEVSTEVSDLVMWGLDLAAQHLEDQTGDGAADLAERGTKFFAAVKKALGWDEGAPAIEEVASPPPPPKPEPDPPRPTESREITISPAREPPPRVPAPVGPGPVTARTRIAPATTTGNITTERRLAARESDLASGSAAARLGAGLGDIVRIHGDTVAELTRLTGELVIHHATLIRIIQSLWSHRDGAPGGARAPAGQLGSGPLRRLRDEGFEASLRIDELEDVVRRMRLLDVSVLFERYPSAIRELARERKKKVRVIVDKGEVAVDKQVLDLIDASVLHLVRNSIDHGIETVAERRAAGKAEQGTVTLAARQHGSRVIIEIRDDGRGMSPDRLRRTAAQRGVMSVEEARALDDDAALALVFRPGFSTRHEVTDVSGRGVGLDVVSDHVRALGGTVGLVTEVGRGTSFTLDLPVSVALLQVLCIRSGAAIFGIPATAVDQVVRVPRAGLERAGHGHAIQVEGRRVPVADLRREQGTGAIEVVVIAHGEARIGLCIDGFLGKRQVVQRSLGAFLSGLSLVSGTALLEEGKVAVLLSAAEIAHRFADGDAKLQLALPELHAATGEWRVLVVDDSELTRDMLVALARRARLIVAEAVNGRDALDKIRAEPPDLILTDLDMPIMNGFQLIAAVRADRTHRDIPIIVLSTRGSDHDKRRALAAGASAYLVKSELKEEALHGAIRRFLAAASDGAVHL